MTDISKLCMVCLSEKDENGICPRCKKAAEVIQEAPCLPLKTIVAGRYLIGKAVKKNGEGITYPAFDIKTDKKVTVREFFPDTVAVRDEDEISVLPANGSETAFGECFNAFAALWKKLMRLRGLTALINVNDVFQANGTLYAVYAESELITLRDYLLQTKEGFLSWDKARILFMPILSTLGTLHTSGIIHRGINPSAFVFSKEGKLKLTDFCTETARTAYGDITPEVFDGYTPYEQYTGTGSTGPWSDIYSFCSVLYRALIGTTPIDAKTRALNDQMMIPAKFAENLPPYVINALINGMQIKPSDRTDNIEQLRNDLSASPRAIAASQPVYEEQIKPEPAKPAPEKSTVSAGSPTKPINVSTPAPKPKTESAARQAAVNAQIEMQQKENKKKNVLIAVLCVILALLIFAIGFLISSIADIKHPGENSTEQTQQANIAAVPNFVGLMLDDVMKNTQYTDFFTIKTESINDPNVENGRIARQSLPAGSKAEKGFELVLYVSTGPKMTELPDVSAYSSYEQAEAALKAMGLICEKSVKQNTTDSTAGKVAESIPPAGTRVKPGEKIIIVVYADMQEETTVPNLSPSGGNSVEEFLSGLDTPDF